MTPSKGIQKMATFEDLILTNKVLGPEYKRGLDVGARRFLRRQLEKRFGAIPEWAEQQLNRQSMPDLEALAVRLLDVQSLEELFQQP